MWHTNWSTQVTINSTEQFSLRTFNKWSCAHLETQESSFEVFCSVFVLLEIVCITKYVSLQYPIHLCNHIRVPSLLHCCLSFLCRAQNEPQMLECFRRCQGCSYQFLKYIELNKLTMWKQRSHCWVAKIVSVALIIRLWTNMVEFIADQSAVLQYFANCPSLTEFHRTLWKWERKFWISQNALQFVFITWLKQSLKCT